MVKLEIEAWSDRKVHLADLVPVLDQKVLLEIPAQSPSLMDRLAHQVPLVALEEKGHLDLQDQMAKDSEKVPLVRLAMGAKLDHQENQVQQADQVRKGHSENRVRATIVQRQELLQAIRFRIFPFSPQNVAKCEILCVRLFESFSVTIDLLVLRHIWL